MNVRRWFLFSIFLGLGVLLLDSIPIIASGRPMNQLEIETSILGMLTMWAIGFIIVCTDYLYKIDTKEQN